MQNIDHMTKNQLFETNRSDLMINQLNACFTIILMKAPNSLLVD